MAINGNSAIHGCSGHKMATIALGRSAARVQGYASRHRTASFRAARIAAMILITQAFIDLVHPSTLFAFDSPVKSGNIG